MRRWRLDSRSQLDAVTTERPELTAGPAPSLLVPCASVITLTHLSSGRYEAAACSPDALVARGIRLAPSMVVDHAFGFYQLALDQLAEAPPDLRDHESTLGLAAAKAV